MDGLISFVHHYKLRLFMAKFCILSRKNKTVAKKGDPILFNFVEPKIKRINTRHTGQLCQGKEEQKLLDCYCINFKDSRNRFYFLPINSAMHFIFLKMDRNHHPVAERNCGWSEAWNWIYSSFTLLKLAS